MAGLTGREEKGPNPGRCGEVSRLLTSDWDQRYTRIKSECVGDRQWLNVLECLPIYLLRKLKAFARRCCGSTGARSVGYRLWLLRLQPFQDGLQRLDLRR